MYSSSVHPNSPSVRYNDDDGPIPLEILPLAFAQASLAMIIIAADDGGGCSIAAIVDGMGYALVVVVVVVVVYVVGHGGFFCVLCVWLLRWWLDRPLFSGRRQSLDTTHGSSRDIPTIIITPNNNKKPPREVGAAHPMGKKEESRMEPSHTYFYHTTRSKATIGR
jgi:hypothetical protein